MAYLKICIASHAYPTQSGERAGVFVRELAETLVKVGLNVHAFIPMRGAAPDELNGVSLHYFRASPNLAAGSLANDVLRTPGAALLWSFWSALRGLISLSKSENFHVVHAQWALPMGLVCAAASQFTGTPSVITTHGRDVYLNSQAGYIVPSLWYTKPLLRWTLGKARAVIAVSRDCRLHALRAGAPSHKTRVIYNGTNVEMFRPDVQPIDLRATRRIPVDSTVLLTVRTLSKRKGIHTLLRSVARLIGGGHLIDLVVIGDGPERRALDELAQRLGISGRVHFLGTIDRSQLPAYYAAADIFVIPSLEEAFGIAAIEAMAAGKPVVSTDAGGLPEVVDDRVTGLVVPRGNEVLLADALETLLKDKSLQEEIGRRARQVVVERFNLHTAALQTKNVYEELVAL